MLAFGDTGYEQAIAHLIIATYARDVSFIMPGLKGLIVYPCDEAGSDRLMTAFQQYI